jgi:hypothetical protein
MMSYLPISRRMTKVLTFIYEPRASLGHFFEALDKDAAIVAVCGLRKKTFEKTDKLRPPRESEKPLLDEWILADFALFHHLLRQHPGPQDWLTDIDLNLDCEPRPVTAWTSEPNGPKYCASGGLRSVLYSHSHQKVV